MSTPVEQAPVPDLASDEVRRRSRSTLWLGLLWPAALLVLAAVLTRIELPPEVQGALDGRMRPGLLALGLLAAAASIVAMGMRWRALVPRARERGLTLPVMTALVAVAQLLGSALPGPVGELAAAGLLKRRGGVPVEEALASAVHARALGLLASALLALVIPLVSPLGVPPEWRTALLVGASVAAVGAFGLFGLVLASPRLQRLPEPRLLGRLDAADGRAAALLARGLRSGRSFVQACAGIGGGGLSSHAVAMVWAVAALGCAAGATLFTLEGLGAAYDPAGVLFSHGAISVLGLALILLPGMAAGWDAAFVALLVTTASVPLVPAVAVTGLLRVYQTVMMSFGAPALAWLLREPPPPPQV